MNEGIVCFHVSFLFMKGDLTLAFTPQGYHKTKNNSGASIFFSQIRAKKTLKIQAPGKNFHAPWRPGALYLSTPVTPYSRSQRIYLIMAGSFPTSLLKDFRIFKAGA
jgi:hypothetical protein